jgi:hypothetical protein
MCCFGPIRDTPHRFLKSNSVHEVSTSRFVYVENYVQESTASTAAGIPIARHSLYVGNNRLRAVHIGVLVCLNASSKSLTIV